VDFAFIDHEGNLSALMIPADHFEGGLLGIRQGVTSRYMARGFAGKQL
jgi:hypothetical protein